VSKRRNISGVSFFSPTLIKGLQVAFQLIKLATIRRLQVRGNQFVQKFKFKTSLHQPKVVNGYPCKSIIFYFWRALLPYWFVSSRVIFPPSWEENRVIRRVNLLGCCVGTRLGRDHYLLRLAIRKRSFRGRREEHQLFQTHTLIRVIPLNLNERIIIRNLAIALELHGKWSNIFLRPS